MRASIGVQLTLAGGRRNVRPILLHLRGSETLEAVPIDSRLPAQKLLERQSVSLARFFYGQESPANGGDDRGFPPYHPA